MTSSESVRARFTGNTCLYVFAARYRPPVFLRRNIEAVLRKCELEEGEYRAGGEMVTPFSGNSTPVGDCWPNRSAIGGEARAPTRRAESLNQIVARLRPPIPSGGRNEPVLRIEAKSLKRKRLYHLRLNRLSSSEDDEPNTLFRSGTRRSFDRPLSIRCRCELTVYEKVDKTRPPSNTRKTRARSKEESGRNQLFRSNEFCTITYDSEETACIEMDEPFFIKASKLFVLTNRGPIASFGLAESYVAEFALQPINTDQPWPPLIPHNSEKWGDLTALHLVAVLHSLPMAPSTAQHELELRMGTLGNPGDRSDLTLELDCKWNDARTITTGGESNHSRLLRLPTPVSEGGQDVTPASSTVTCYFFNAPVDDERLHAYFGQPTPKNQHTFTVPRYTCPFCDGREFRNLTSLHFHLITSHDLFQFKVKQRKLPSNFRERHRSFVEVFVDLAKEATVGRASDHVPDHRTFRWVKPAQRLEIHRILHGDWSWLNEKKGIFPQNRRDIPPKSATVPVVLPLKIDLKDVEELPVKRKRKYRVPEPKNGLEGPVFIRSRSKRFVRTGEELSESDDDVDENWLKMEHQEIIEDFVDVARNEQVFMQLWDKHLFIERPIGYAHIPQVLVRFSRAQAEFLRTSELLVEFWKHCLNLAQHGVIDTECLAFCMKIVKGEGQWSSVGKSEWGIGLAGPLALDTPDARFRIEDEMDVDRDEDRVKKEQKPAEDSGFCVCGGPFEKPEMIICNGLKCKRRWFHRSCFGVERMLDGWQCPTCAKSMHHTRV